jgi:hypothetical protein
VNALNLPLSPEKMEFWECADLLDVSASETGMAIQTSDIRPPGVSDSIELDNDNGVTRRASEKHPKVLGESIPDRRDSNRVWSTNVKGGGQKTPMRGMEASVTAMV